MSKRQRKLCPAEQAAQDHRPEIDALKLVQPSSLHGNRGDICQTVYYERKHLGTHMRDPVFSPWIRTGTRFYRCTEREDRCYTFVHNPLTSEERKALVVWCKLVHLTESANNYYGPDITYYYDDDRWYFCGKNCLIRRDNIDTFTNQAWHNVSAEEFERWWPKADQGQLTCTQFAASCPRRLPWPVVDIVLGYLCPTFVDIGFPRAPVRYDHSGPVPRAIGSLG